GGAHRANRSGRGSGCARLLGAQRELPRSAARGGRGRRNRNRLRLSSSDARGGERAAGAATPPFHGFQPGRESIRGARASHGCHRHRRQRGAGAHFLATSQAARRSSGQEDLMKRWWMAAAMLALGLSQAHSQAPAPNQPPAPNQAPAQTVKPVIYAIGTAHLDTQWNWTVQDTIRLFLPATLLENFKLFEKYPHYVFNYEGAIHYMWFKEYYPEAWAKLQKYVADGRWRLSGSWINAVDTNVPSPESLMRQALYGKRFFRQEFSKVSHDLYLPDCFGFGFALPSIAA